jgi:hypothetical protein
VVTCCCDSRHEQVLVPWGKLLQQLEVCLWSAAAAVEHAGGVSDAGWARQLVWQLLPLLLRELAGRADNQVQQLCFVRTTP